GGLHQIGKGGQARVKSAHDIEAGVGRGDQLGNPMRRKRAAGRGNSNYDGTGAARGGLAGRETRESKRDATTRQAPFAHDVVRTPVPETEGGLRRQFILDVAEKQ